MNIVYESVSYRLHKTSNNNQNLKYSIICLFRNAMGPEEKFGLDRVRITESFMFSLKN